MAFTAHGHHIMGTTLDGAYKGSRARCGGPGLCADCTAEASAAVDAEQEWPIEDPSSGIVNLGSEMFANGDLSVISYKGENYYQSCGEVVTGSGHPDEESTTCVRRVRHPGRIHEDWDDNTREDEWVFKFDDILKRGLSSALLRTGLSKEEVYNAVNAIQISGITLSKNAR